MDPKERIYLDNNATTQLDPHVSKLMLTCLNTYMGNPSSVHFFGQEAQNQLVEARRTIAGVLNVRPSEIVFTSGGTEGLNLLIRGIAGRHETGHILSSDLEHSAVFETVKALSRRAYDATFLSPGLYGAATVDQVAAALRPDTRLIVLMAANNETGVKTDIEGIAALAGSAGVPFVLDCVGLFGKERLFLPKGVTAAAFSGHKFHGPKGAGMLYIKRGTKLEPMMTGGGHELGYRPGTENLSGIVGLAEAVHRAEVGIVEASESMRSLRDHLESSLQERVADVHINGEGPRVSNTSNVAFAGVDGESLLMSLDLAGIAVSHGSACNSGALQPSRVLINMGVPPELARSSLRFSVSRFTTRAEIDRVVDAVVGIVQRLPRVASA